MKFNIKIPPAIKTTLGKLKGVAKHHYFILIVFLFSSLALAVYMVNETLNSPSDVAYRDEQMHSTIGTKFNKAAKETIETIKSLQKTSDPNDSQPDLPSGRINPFAE